MERLDALLWMAIQEDLEHGDVTSETVIEAQMLGTAVVVGREPFVLSGSQAFCRIFQLMDSAVDVKRLFQDGESIPSDIPVFEIRGRVRTLLTAERTALNLLQRLCGVATLTRRMVDALEGTSCRLLDTRKTTPLWRTLEKEAVRHGGGFNHRFGLSDGVLIKDNHIGAVGSVGEAVRRARRGAPHTLKIEVEVENLDELEEALEEGADIVLLDNFPLDRLKEAVIRNRGRALLEASGGITLERVRAIAETGVNFISSGALTHSARAIDLSLEFSH
ncbi:MAG: carboxylating nicotinate-nucleotide diphosphorylase [Deltaproteobacteria bacterium]|nr:carboxylating nicotinate-nucleotide diphosphorylase [Deltaproteobacteria bacterium]